MKPGWKTSECWHAIIAQGLAFLTVLGVVNANDSHSLEESITKCVTAVFALLGNGYIVIQYLKHRFELKNAENWPKETVGITQVPDPGKVVVPILIGFALLLMAGPANAQSIFPWRNGISQQIKQHDQQINQLIGQGKTPQAPSQPQIIVIPPQMAHPPQQTFPIQGQPQQQLPIQGQPQQQFPIQGQPQQQLPIQGQPQQQLPIQGQPQQQFPIAGPVEPLPIMPPADQNLIQPYSRHRALSYPID